MPFRVLYLLHRATSWIDKIWHLQRAPLSLSYTWCYMAISTVIPKAGRSESILLLHRRGRMKSTTFTVSIVLGTQKNREAGALLLQPPSIHHADDDHRPASCEGFFSQKSSNSCLMWCSECLYSTTTTQIDSTPPSPLSWDFLLYVPSHPFSRLMFQNVVRSLPSFAPLRAGVYRARSPHYF